MGIAVAREWARRLPGPKFHQSALLHEEVAHPGR
jgi:hypothetical protein